MAPAIQLEDRRGGRVKRQLVSDVQDYVAAQASYERRAKDHKKNFGVVGLEALKAPPIPPYLSMWFELQRWPGSLLWDGGLLDQPAWVWDLMDLAGMVYTDLMTTNVEAVQGMQDV